MLEKEAILGYWSIAGNAQAMRYLLAYVGARWKDKLYIERSEWFEKDKKQLHLTFPNLPYLLDGNMNITETSALLRYIPKRWGYPELLGRTVEEQLKVDMYLGVLQDIWSAASPLMFSQNWKEEKETTLHKIQAGLSNLIR